MYAAIKILHSIISPFEQQMFLDEAKTLALLKHPNIVNIIDFGLDGDVPYLMMEYCSQGTLRDRHRKGTIVPLETVVLYVNQITTALQFAHDAKRIHRDLKPDNLLVHSSGEIVLSDFGIFTMAHKTRSMQQIPYAGTPAYSAPEQFLGTCS